MITRLQPIQKKPLALTIDGHNVLDYVLGVGFISAPYVLGFSDVDNARNTFETLGFSLVIYSLLTQYRYSVYRLVPLGVHMALDIAVGVIAMLAPWMLSYSILINRFQYAMHFVFGLAMIGLVVMTRPRSGRLAQVTDVDFELRRSA
jgi:hypothetical protein